jgi:hypothetical protein
MKKPNFLKMTAVLAFFFFANLQAFSQPGNFDFTNNTANPLTVYLFADYDDCAGNYLCAAPPVVVAPGNTHTFTGVCTTNGAWKFMKVVDSCNGTVVGYCGYPTTAAFTDCSSNTVTVDWIDEHTGEAN